MSLRSIVVKVSPLESLVVVVSIISIASMCCFLFSMVGNSSSMRLMAMGVRYFHTFCIGELVVMDAGIMI